MKGRVFIVFAALFLAGCSSIRPKTEPEPWSIPTRPTIDSIKTIDGKVCYGKRQHRKLLEYVTKLENRAVENGAVR